MSSWTDTGVPTGSVSTLHELGVAAGETYGDLKSIGCRDAVSGEWRWTSFAERAVKAQALGNALTSYGAWSSPCCAFATWRASERERRSSSSTVVVVSGTEGRSAFVRVVSA